MGNDELAVTGDPVFDWVLNRPERKELEARWAQERVDQRAAPGLGEWGPAWRPDFTMRLRYIKERDHWEIDLRHRISGRVGSITVTGELSGSALERESLRELADRLSAGQEQAMNGLPDGVRVVVVVGAAAAAAQWREWTGVAERATILVNDPRRLYRLRGLDGQCAAIVVLDGELVADPEIQQAIGYLRARGAVDLTAPAR